MVLAPSSAAFEHGLIAVRSLRRGYNWVPARLNVVCRIAGDDATGTPRQVMMMFGWRREQA